MLYLYTDELATYAARSNFGEADKIPSITIASELTEAFLGRTLAITEYTEIVRLSAGLSGWLSTVPITEVVSIRVRKIRKTMQGGYSVAADGWYDVVTDDFENFVNFSTGRVDLYTPVWDGYDRFTMKESSGVTRYEAEITYRAGFFASTTLTEDTEADDTEVFVSDSSDFEAGMKVTLGTTGVLRTVQSVDGDKLTLTEAVGDIYSVYDEINQRVSKPIKIAVGMVCEDRATFLPNVLRQSRRISVLSDTLRRSNTLPIPPDAMSILAKYRRRIWT